MPRSISTPRSQPRPRYLLYSSLMFCHSQAPISITTKCPAQPQFPSIFWSWPKHHSPPEHYMSFLPTIIRWLHSTLWSHIPWQLEVAHPKRSITHHQFPFVPYPFLPPVPVSTFLTLTIPVYLTLGHMTFPVWIIIHL